MSTSTNPLVEAIHNRDGVRAFEVLRERPELASMRGERALSPLMLALYNGLEDIARAIQPLAGQLDVFDAAAIGDVEQLRQLITNDAIANAWSEDGFTPLHLAAFFGRAESVRLLIDRGAGLETPSRNEQFAGARQPTSPEPRRIHGLPICWQKAERPDPAAD
jgi:ankyrin repeat protein